MKKKPKRPKPKKPKYWTVTMSVADFAKTVTPTPFEIKLAELPPFQETNYP